MSIAPQGFAVAGRAVLMGCMHQPQSMIPLYVAAVFLSAFDTIVLKSVPACILLVTDYWVYTAWVPRFPLVKLPARSGYWSIGTASMEAKECIELLL